MFLFLCLISGLEHVMELLRTSEREICHIALDIYLPYVHAWGRRRGQVGRDEPCPPRIVPYVDIRTTAT